MEQSQLQSFLRVAEEGSITRAAEALCLTQPAVTQHVRALERELGALLFERLGRGVRLTAAGRALRRYARRSLALLDECRQVIADLEAGVAGRLLLGAGVTTSIFQLPAWLRAFQEAYPGVDVAVRTGGSQEIATRVREREVDLGLVTSPIEHRDLHVIGLYEEEILLVTPPGYPLAGQAVDRDAWTELPLILFPRGTGFRAYLDRAFAEAGIVARVKMESDSVEAIKSFVAVGLGASFLPAAAVRAEIAIGAMAPARPVDLPRLLRRTSAIHRADRYMSAAARHFLDLLQSRGAKISP
jgi:DNA-binding transcriptional LysR family regulator